VHVFYALGIGLLVATGRWHIAEQDQRIRQLTEEAAMAKAAPVKISRKDVERYVELEAERKELSRRSADLKKTQDEIGQRLTAYLKAEAGKVGAAVKFGYRLALKARQIAVQWKKEFIRVAGQDEADRLSADAGTSHSLEVRRLE